MNAEFLNAAMSMAHYTLKEGTSSSYINTDFANCNNDLEEKKRRIEVAVKNSKESLLPIRISIIDNGGTAKVSASGRGATPSVKQMKSKFTRIEISPYKQYEPYQVCTSIWRVEGYRCYYYGTIGINPAEGLPPKDNGDLIIFHTSDWKDISIYIFKGMNKPNDFGNLQEITHFIDTRINIR